MIDLDYFKRLNDRLKERGVLLRLVNGRLVAHKERFPQELFKLLADVDSQRETSG